MAMNVSLTPELEKFVNEKVKDGLYNSASEVVRAALRMLKQQDDIEQLKMEELKRRVREGIAQMDAGQGVPLEVVRAEFEERWAKQGIGKKRAKKR